MMEWYERVLGDVKDLTRDLRDSTEEIERIKIRAMETFSELRGRYWTFWRCNQI